MERNPLASLMMGLRGGGGSTEGARAYPGGYERGLNFDNLKPEVQHQLKNYWGYGPGETVPLSEVSSAQMRANPGGYENAGSGGKSYGTQWDPVEVANAQAYTGLDANKWAKLDHSTQFKYITEAQDWQQAIKQPVQLPAPPEWSQYEASPSYPTPVRTMPEYLPGQPTVRAYHGSTTGPVPVSMEQLSEYAKAGVHPRHLPDPNKFTTPGEWRTEQGVFFTPDPETASRYAGYSTYKHADTTHGAKVFPVDLDMRNSVTVDLRKIPGMTNYQRIYDPKYVQTAIEQAKQQNKDFVVIKGMSDVGGEADQIIAVRPAGKVKNAITGETMYAHPLSSLLAAALAGGTVSRRQRADETTIAPENIGRP